MMNKTTSGRNLAPTTWGYARASTEKQDTSVPRQIADIQATAKKLGLDLYKTRSEHASASRISFRERPEFAKLMEEMNPNDHLIVWRLDRLDRNFYRILECVGWLDQRGIKLHLIREQFGLPLDLSTAVARATVAMMAMVADIEQEFRLHAIAEGKRWRQSQGLAIGKFPGMGKRREHVRRKGRLVKLDVWDPVECNTIREIYRRYAEGETMAVIAEDLVARGVKTAAGRKWANKRRQCSMVTVI